MWGIGKCFLNQQHAINAKAEVSRLSGYLMDTRNARRDDRYKNYSERKNEGYAKQLAGILGPMVSKESKPIIGAEGTYKD